MCMYVCIHACFVLISCKTLLKFRPAEILLHERAHPRVPSVTSFKKCDFFTIYEAKLFDFVFVNTKKIYYIYGSET